MTVISPTDPTHVVLPVTEVDRDELRAAVHAAEPGPLLMAMVHMTGDTSLVAEFRARLDAERGAVPPVPGRYPEAVAAEVRARAFALFEGGMVPKLTVPSDALFRRMAEVCVDDAVGEEFTAHLREMGGFEPARRHVPVTKVPPPGFKVIVIGAGMVGLNAGIKLAEADFDYQIFEERDDIGGTWSRNVYPGAAVDTPSHFYSYSFELNPNWSRYYPTGPEYLDYMRHVVDKYGLRSRIALSTKVLRCEWTEETRRWKVMVRAADGSAQVHEANAVITATGILNAASIPDIDGMDAFTGTVMHTAEWDPKADLTGRRVALLGTGCTAVQVAAELVDQVEALHVVFRQPHWIVPEPMVEAAVPEAVRWAMARIPYYQQWFRVKTYWYAGDKGWDRPRIDPEWSAAHLSVSPANDVVMRVCLNHLERTFPDRPDLRAALTPDFPPYAKRIVKDPGFLAALGRENVSVHRASFRRIEPDGVVTTEGEFLKADVIVFATGFKLEFLSFMDVVGRDGRKLANEWAGQDPRAHLGIMVPGFPNFFVTAGPNSAPNHGGGHNLVSEGHVHYVIECLQYLVENSWSAMEPKREVVEEYNRRVDEALDKTVWKHGGTATGYYRNASGRAWVSCPWRLVDYWTMLRAPRPEDYYFTETGQP
ncbi:Predicted flavoprotein CzcO associated with the cation diffusion facilitator CzcD [Thermomonospora echinospora]|uniref:Predicted flavoprotein CzcO associated with the cation diffusion facilitator CzcD n=1 Tax=Thermomonospora echinospora TaxID=1992 RepID=A0A1H6E4Z2_9ACTN|nr:NAD(P)/FAD-dependent oxidoreductase [Thermomonospora echinospora]SEG92742.1 Predicted flavoprotein CzcO associated with the cation diffusion facilitator CzcD [Thermomonospora echinospora]